MMFQRKIERAQKWLKERNQGSASRSQDPREDDLPSMEDLKRESQEPPLDKSDLPAMLFAAFITIMPVCILVLLLLCAFVFFL